MKYVWGISMSEWIRTRAGLKEILKFLVGGGSAVFVDFILYMLLKAYIGISVAKTISYISGAAVGFAINKFWTFESKTFRICEIYRYIVLYICSACVNILINKMVLAYIPAAFFAFLCATGTSTVLNFLGQKFFVFRGGCRQ